MSYSSCKSALGVLPLRLGLQGVDCPNKAVLWVWLRRSKRWVPVVSSFTALSKKLSSSQRFCTTCRARATQTVSALHYWERERRALH